MNYLEDDGFSLQLRPSFEYGVNDLQKLFPLQYAGIVLLKVLNKVVEDKVRPCVCGGKRKKKKENINIRYTRRTGRNRFPSHRRRFSGRLKSTRSTWLRTE